MLQILLEVRAFFLLGKHKTWKQVNVARREPYYREESMN